MVPVMRPAFALDSRRFGRRPMGFLLGSPEPIAAKRLSNDVQLFATTFGIGFLFVSILIS